MFYSETDQLDEATHVKVVGQPGNIEVVSLYSSDMTEEKNTFLYRFIQFKFEGGKFRPILFDCVKSHK